MAVVFRINICWFTLSQKLHTDGNGHGNWEHWCREMRVVVIGMGANSHGRIE